MSLYSIGIVRQFIVKHIFRKPKRRLALTKLFYRDSNKYIELVGSRIYVNSISEMGYVRAASNAQSNIVFRDEVASLISVAMILEPSDTFVDVGANVGLYSSVLGRFQYVFPSMRFYAFEANPDTGVKLRETLSDKATNVEIVGISDKAGILPFAKGAVSGVFGALRNASDFQCAEWVVDIPTKRLDQCEIVGSSIVLKIDVEGHEWEVLQGATGFFDSDRIKAVYLDGFDNKQIPSFLESKGFVAFDGRSLKRPPTQEFSVLFIKESWLNSASFGPKSIQNA